MQGHPVASQNSGNTFVTCFSDIFEIKKSSRVSEIVLWGVVFREKNFFRFDFDFALGNFDTKSILNFDFTKLFFDTKSILNFDFTKLFFDTKSILDFGFTKNISNIYQFQNHR
jgi:hypothetical protein